MRKSILLLVLSLVLLLTFGVNVYAQNKEVSEPGTTTYYVTSKVLPLGEGILYFAYEATGLTVNDTGGGLFHNATVRTLGGMKIEKNEFKNERGWGVWNLQGGDKVFGTYEMAGNVNPGGVSFAKGMFTITGGTGKAAGIKGSFEMTRRTARSTLEGVGISYSKGTIKYILP
ncbi:MAG: hypothetical protein ABSE05_16390 [Syntrophales bacterium]|jgi:hypothetical protein